MQRGRSDIVTPDLRSMADAPTETTVSAVDLGNRPLRKHRRTHSRSWGKPARFRIQSHGCHEVLPHLSKGVLDILKGRPVKCDATHLIGHSAPPQCHAIGPLAQP